MVGKLPATRCVAARERECSVRSVKSGATAFPPPMRGREPCGARFRNSRHVPVVDFQRGTGSVGPHAFTYSVVKQRCLDVACKEAKQNRPLFAALGQGVARIPLLPSPSKSRGMARRQGAVPGLLRAGCPACAGRWVHNGAPAPCGAPTRHLGLYAFDRGRTGPAPSGRRGCPSTARGRRLRKSFARRCRSRSPPTERLRKAPLELGSG
jgi:hypothetical protein